MRGESDARAAVLAACRHAEGPWWRVAQLIEEAGDALTLLERGADSVESVELLSSTLSDDRRLLALADIAEFERMIDATRAEGDDLVTVVDERYPTNLRLVYDRPPFLFVRGAMPDSGMRALAVVGTRAASPEGLKAATSIAGGLARRGIVVVSGLARGIDTAAHEATIAAGGKTVAVVGTGLRRVYPPENAQLAQRIVESGGAIVSQFFPDSPPAGFHFPLRNRTMSGLALGTAVVEASKTSGARMQARIALEHGKRVFLISGLVTRELWARQMLMKPGAVEVDSIDAILEFADVLEARSVRPVEQLTLA